MFNLSAFPLMSSLSSKILPFIFVLAGLVYYVNCNSSLFENMMIMMGGMNFLVQQTQVFTNKFIFKFEKNIEINWVMFIKVGFFKFVNYLYQSINFNIIFMILVLVFLICL